MKINIFYLLSKISIILISLLCILSILLFYNNAVTLNSLYILISVFIIGSVIRLNKLKKFTRVLFTIIILPILSYLMVNLGQVTRFFRLHPQITGVEQIDQEEMFVLELWLRVELRYRLSFLPYLLPFQQEYLWDF